MPLSESGADSLAGGRKRRKPPSPSPSPSTQYRRHFPRARKKQKRLDAICDHVMQPAQLREETSVNAERDSGSLRRSTRERKPVVAFNGSPSPSKKRKRRINRPPKKIVRKNEDPDDREKRVQVEIRSPDRDLEESGSWALRLRSRAKNATASPSKEKGTIKLYQELGIPEEARKLVKSKVSKSNSTSTRKNGKETVRESEDETESASERKRVTESVTLSDNDEEGNAYNPKGLVSDSNREPTLSIDEAVSNATGEAPYTTKEDVTNASNDIPSPYDKIGHVKDENQVHLHDPTEQTTVQGNEQLEETSWEPEKEVDSNSLGVVAGDGAAKSLENANDTKSNKLSASKCSKSDRSWTSGRRCGLCGGGTDGKPPKKLVQDCGDSDNEVYGESSASEELSYEMWDGFDHEPGWLGPLLGPIHDRFGIAGVWVHQHCAVWSPEVYFAGLGCLKNVRAALCRGRALKCTRCGRPGATIGCRVDRCPKTYHLPCARVEGSIFDHRKFLIACADHRHLFQPQGNHYLHRIKKLKAKKLRLEMRKLSNEASRKDLEAEEKWLENCGEDEEFLRREGRRLHRDLLRIAPVYIGGESRSETGKSYPGFESVAGLQGVIQCMKEVVILPLLYPEFFGQFGLTPPRGVLLHGHPGTGKTLVVRALIGACSRGDKRIAYFARKGADCLGKYVGDAERQLRLLFQVAEKSQPSIIFFDEIDGLAPRRSKQQDQTHSSVVSTLLALLDGLKSRGSVIVIGATNRPEAVDPALRRPGRFDREIYFPLPSLNDRSAILSLHTREWPKPVSGSLLNWIAEKTAGYAGADLQALCTQAAMIALKRNCSLQELLSTAERYACHGRRLSLPPFTVEEQDWLAALASAPPPCSRREAGMCANDVVSFPLYPHLLPCLIKPLIQLLISLYLDERIWLPHLVHEAGKLLKNVVFSALECKKIPLISWREHLHHLILEPHFAKDIERHLYLTGLLIGSLISDGSGVVQNNDCCSPKTSVNASGVHLARGLMQNKTVSLDRRSGFRVLIAGSRKCGQRHMAACLLHGFVGHVEVQKASLATISQEGRGDMTLGISRILLKCSSLGQCVIYMPRIDLWALDDTSGETAGKEARTCSEAWSTFVEQLNSLSSMPSFVVLATCEVLAHFLPDRIREFFASDVSNCASPGPPEHTIPRFTLQLDGKFNHKLVLDLCAERLSEDLIKQYVQLIHHQIHLPQKSRGCKASEMVSNHSEIQVHGMESLADKAIISDGGEWPSQIKPGGPRHKIELQPLQDCAIKAPSNRIMKGKSCLLYSIATFGYQILRYPQFAELCWATSKLKEGPCTGVNGPWKVWPFNSCFIRPQNSVEKAPAGSKTSETSIVRGLVAVGLLAYRGIYSSVTEVSLQVRRVLELLVEQINIKIIGGKDQYQFFRLLSQVAYLEDLVNSWAYALQSLEPETQVSASNAKPATEQGSHFADEAVNSSFLVKDGDGLQNAVEDSSHKFPPGNGQNDTSNGKVTDFALLNDDKDIIVPEVESSQEMVSLSASACSLTRPLIPNSGVCIVSHESEIAQEMVHLSSSSPASGHNSIIGSQPSCQENPLRRSEGLVPNGFLRKELDSSKQSKGPLMIHSNCRNATHKIPLVMEDGVKPDEAIQHADSNSEGYNNDLSTTESVCVYSCCSECVLRVHALVREIIGERWDSNNSCSTIEDIHDTVETCSVSLLATLRKPFVSKCCTKVEECGGMHHKLCGCHDVGNGDLNEVSRRVKAKSNECGCLSKSTHSLSGIMGLKFFFKDCMLLPTDPNEDVSFHCKYEKLCICSAIKKISLLREPNESLEKLQQTSDELP